MICKPLQKPQHLPKRLTCLFHKIIPLGFKHLHLFVAGHHLEIHRFKMRLALRKDMIGHGLRHVVFLNLLNGLAGCLGIFFSRVFKRQLKPI